MHRRRHERIRAQVIHFRSATIEPAGQRDHPQVGNGADQTRMNPKDGFLPPVLSLHQFPYVPAYNFLATGAWLILEPSFTVGLLPRPRLIPKSSFTGRATPPVPAPGSYHS